MKEFVVYILKTSGNTLYTGQTNNLEKRLVAHILGTGAKYMRKYESFDLVYVEKVATLSQALRREWEIKKLPRVKKLELVKSAFGTQFFLEQSNRYFDKTNIQHMTKAQIKSKLK